jgi:GNAT superfamily N-acetyltransferase
MNTSAISISRVSRSDPQLLELVALLDADLNSRYGIVQAQYDQFNSLATVDAAVIAHLNGQSIGCGCYRRIDETTAEIKRMFVRPENRGSGAAAQLLAELESWASEGGAKRAILETGIKNPEAIRFYTKSGYSRIDNYGQYAGKELSVCMAKSLAAS